ncbi:recombinase family protein [Amycolatopsis sp. NPDC021455]|uniref:recombinase family protein n=1 Tax=Amycolatopsis sp. NPDC021455 TaxID=3154901 RepID=UPI0033D98C3D
MIEIVLAVRAVLLHGAERSGRGAHPQAVQNLAGSGWPKSDRAARAWTLRTVAVILANPRYTGQQTWNRRTASTEGPASMPALSAKMAHPPPVTEQDFVAAQRIRATRPASDGQARRFALAGLIHCGVCDRQLDSHSNHGRPTYRCRHGHTSTQCASQPRPKTLYIREDHLIDEINLRLGDHCNDDHAAPELGRTRHRNVAAALRGSRPVAADVHRARIARYKAALDTAGISRHPCTFATVTSATSKGTDRR